MIKYLFIIVFFFSCNSQEIKNEKKSNLKTIKDVSSLVTLREVNVFFDRYNELDFIYESIEKKTIKL